MSYKCPLLQIYIRQDVCIILFCKISGGEAAYNVRHLVSNLFRSKYLDLLAHPHYLLEEIERWAKIIGEYRVIFLCVNLLLRLV